VEECPEVVRVLVLEALLCEAPPWDDPLWDDPPLVCDDVLPVDLLELDEDFCLSPRAAPATDTRTTRQPKMMFSEYECSFRNCMRPPGLYRTLGPSFAATRRGYNRPHSDEPHNAGLAKYLGLGVDYLRKYLNYSGENCKYRFDNSSKDGKTRESVSTMTCFSDNRGQTFSKRAKKQEKVVEISSINPSAYLTLPQSKVPG
jgi:hypothetical protein